MAADGNQTVADKNDFRNSINTPQFAERTPQSCIFTRWLNKILFTALDIRALVLAKNFYNLFRPINVTRSDNQQQVVEFFLESKVNLTTHFFRARVCADRRNRHPAVQMNYSGNFFRLKIVSET